MHATLCDQQALPVCGQIADDFLGITICNDRSDRHRYFEILAALAGAIAARTLHPAIGFVVSLDPKIGQCVDPRCCNQPDRATITPIATVGTTQRDELFAPETDAAVPSVPGGNPDTGFVNKFHNDLNSDGRPIIGSRITKERNLGKIAGAALAAIGGPIGPEGPPTATIEQVLFRILRQSVSTETNLRLCGPLFANTTLPSALANSV